MPRLSVMKKIGQRDIKKSLEEAVDEEDDDDFEFNRVQDDEKRSSDHLVTSTKLDQINSGKERIYRKVLQKWGVFDAKPLPTFTIHAIFPRDIR